MNRRRFLTSSVATSGAGLIAGTSLAQAQNAQGAENREYYVLRRYHLTSGPQRGLTDAYLRDALAPALNRLGISPVGVFSVEIGPTAPSFYVLMPSASLDTLVGADLRLEKDADYLKAGAAFINASAKDPAYVRVESSLMIAFEGHPKLTVPPVTASHGARMFELRTYESPTDQDHRRKVEMFNSGEYDVFQKAGFWQVFYGDTLVGANQPHLTYMIGFASLAERSKMWDAFRADPGWKKLTGNPRYSFEDIVSTITNVILSPTAYSQV